MKKWLTNNNMIFCIATASIAPVLFLACSGTPKKNKQQEQKQPAATTVVYKKPPSSFNDTIVIKGSAAVFYNADIHQLEKIKAITEKMVFESSIHDCFYQMRNAKMVLKESWPHIHVADISKARYLLFINKDNSQECLDLNTQNDMCGLLLFNQMKKPQLVDMTNIATALDLYFKK